MTFRLATALLALATAGAGFVNYTLNYADGTTLRAEYVGAAGAIVRVVIIPPGANESFRRYTLTVPQPALAPGEGFAVKLDTPSFAILTGGKACALNVSKLEPTTTLLSADGVTVLSAEPQPVSREVESQCGNGHGGPIVGGCLRAWRSIQPGEGIYGFGMQSYTTDHVGTTKWIQTDANPSALGLDHAPAPFFLSSRGYGVALNTHAYSYFDVGYATPSLHLIHSADPVVDAYFFAGPGLADVMGQFTQLYGRTSMPPRFALGLWYHPLMSSNQTHVEGTVAQFADAGVPLAAVTLEPPWQTHAYACTYVVSNATYWDMPGFLAAMAAAGTAVSLWQHAYIFNASQGHVSPLWAPVFGGGLAADWITWGGATPDWTLQATRDVVGAYMRDTFLSGPHPVVAFKLDECDGNAGQNWFFPDNASFPSGFSGARMHNLFGLTYAFTYHELFAAQGTRTFLKARAGYMGGQRYPTTMYSDSYDYGQYIAAVGNNGFLGLSWAPELRDAQSPSDFARRAQLMLLSGLASEDAWNSGFEPFAPFVSPASTAIFKTYYSARAQLVPALYAAYATAGATGLPVVRHPLVDYGVAGGDTTALGRVIDQFIVAGLLVAPAPINGTQRSIYFPAASGPGWVDFFDPTGTVYPNGSTSAAFPCPDAVLPLFQRVGSVLPLADATDPSVLRLRAVAPLQTADSDAAASETLVYDDDGASTRYQPPQRETFEATARVVVIAFPNATNSEAPPSLRLSLTPARVAWAPAWRELRWEIAFPASHPQRSALVDAVATCVTLSAGGGGGGARYLPLESTSLLAAPTLPSEAVPVALQFAASHTGGLLVVSHALPAPHGAAWPAAFECSVAFQPTPHK